MRPVTYIDEKGHKKQSLVRDNDPDADARFGIPCGVPDLELLDWEEIKRNLNNYLFDVGVFTKSDVGRCQTAVTNAVLSCVRKPILLLYREQGRLE